MAVIGDVNIMGPGWGTRWGNGAEIGILYCGSWDRDFGIFIQCY